MAIKAGRHLASAPPAVEQRHQYQLPRNGKRLTMQVQLAFAGEFPGSQDVTKSADFLRRACFGERAAKALTATPQLFGRKGMTNNNNKSTPMGLLTMQQLYEAERTAKKMRAVRRTAMSFVTYNSEDLRKLVEDPDGAEAALATLEAMGTYLEYLEEQVELLSNARGRMFAILSEVLDLPDETGG